MADLKISALTAATTPLAGTEVLPIVQGGVTTKVAVSDLTAGRAVTASSVNKVAITAPATASTLTIADGKTLAVNDNATLGTGGLTLGNSGGFTAAASKVLTANNTLTLAGTDATTHTFPTTSATIARTDAAQTFTGTQSFGDVSLAHVAVNALAANAAYIKGPGTKTMFFYADNNYIAIGDATSLNGNQAYFDSTNNVYVLQLNAANKLVATTTNLSWYTGNVVLATAGYGISLTSPDGLTTKLLTISNLGVLTLT